MNKISRTSAILTKEKEKKNSVRYVEVESDDEIFGTVYMRKGPLAQMNYPEKIKLIVEVL